MTTKELLKQMAIAAFGPAYQEAIRSVYQRDIENGKYEIVEKEYNTAKKALDSSLTEEKKQLLRDYENFACKVREFSANYGFRAGLLCGFKQYYTNDQADDGGFWQHVDCEIARMPNMKRYGENYTNIMRCHTLYALLSQREQEDIQELLVSVSCAWSQRCRSASVDGFYCGYRGAMEILDTVMPLGYGSLQITSKLIRMEHYWGYSLSCSEAERNGQE